jgi:alpha-D-ribose 1-methylphosphonate 5-triphosphate synthase subunit PhnH
MSASLSAGFADPVLDAQRSFRAVMQALARPGSIQTLAAAGFAPPAPLTAELAAVALTLADHDAPLWLDPVLAGVPAIAEFLHFHTGAAIVAEPSRAAFALAGDAALLPPLDVFALGTPEYPDRSTTLVIAVAGLASGQGLVLEGPGIQRQAMLAISGLPLGFADRLRANHRLAPRGVDCLFAAPGRIAGIPRSTRIIGDG